MEHIIQFGVTIDDDKIEKMVTEKASQMVLKNISDATGEFTRSTYYSNSKLSELFKEEVKKVVEENKDMIIESVITNVTTNMMKTKAIIAAKEKIINSVEVE